jgi:hypothetical protein
VPQVLLYYIKFKVTCSILYLGPIK